MSNQADDVVIAGSAGLRDIGEIHARLLAALKSSDRIVLDLAGVEETDITLLQLIEAARREAAASGKTLTLREPANPALRHPLTRGGFLSRAADRLFWLKEESQ